jgi:hypothetical protein
MVLEDVKRRRHRDILVETSEGILSLSVSNSRWVDNIKILLKK